MNHEPTTSPAKAVIAIALLGAVAHTAAACSGSTPNVGHPCTTARDCPAPETSCRLATCDGTKCGVEPAATATPCAESGGLFCDGAGDCVACLSDSDCPDPPGDCQLPRCDRGSCDVASAPLGTACGQPATDPASVSSCDAAGACLPGTFVFVTIDEHGPSFGGTAGADELCADAARWFGGTWLSWTADSHSSPSARFRHSTDPYRLTDGTVVAATWAALTDAADTPLASGIDRDEDGNWLAGVRVWTGCRPSGEYTGFSCDDWMGGGASGEPGAAAGLAGEYGSDWSWKTTTSCTATAHLYCFQQ